MPEFADDKKTMTLNNESTLEIVTLEVRKGFFAKSACMSPVLQKIKHFCGVNSNPPTPIYLRGETGVGKTELAEIFHYNSGRKGRFIDVNCATIPKDLFESEFFGTVQGKAGTGVEDKEGLFKLADNGTLFLDEISQLRIDHQGKLLKAIEEQKVRKVGAYRDDYFNTRLISASNKSLMKLVQDGKFREDLFYRLEGINIFIPPLRDREEDIIDLASEILKKHNISSKREITFSTDFKLALENYDYPGNIRQLKTIIERCVGQCDMETKQSIDLEIALKASNGGQDWMGFGLDSKSDLVRFYEKYLHEIDFKNKSLHDLAIEIVSSFQNNNMIEELCNTDEIVGRLRSKLQLDGSHTIGINNSTKELIAKLNKALDRTLGSKSIESDEVLNFLKTTDDLTIFQQTERIRNSAISRLSRNGMAREKIAEMLDLSGARVSQIIKEQETSAVRSTP